MDINFNASASSSASSSWSASPPWESSPSTSSSAADCTARNATVVSTSFTKCTSGSRDHKENKKPKPVNTNITYHVKQEKAA